jgi:plastocyanin
MLKLRVAFFMLLSSAFMLVLVGCKNDTSSPYGSSYSTPPATQPNTVAIANMAFGPSTITVARNTTVTFKNSDSMTHTATSDNGAWDTGDITYNGSKATTFATAGTFPYHCTHHLSMKATIIVQ